MTRTAVCLIAAVLLLSFVVTAQAVEPPTNTPSKEPKTYVATTTLMDPIALSDTASPEAVRSRVAMLTGIATSIRVMREAIATLRDLGIDLSSSELTDSTRVYATGAPGVLAISVHLPDARFAKVTADVLAAELKRLYGEIRLAAPRQTREFLEEQVEVLRQQMKKAYAAWDGHKKKVKVHSAEDPELAVLQADAQIARDNYMAISARLFDAKLDEQEAQSRVALMTIDAAYVVPAQNANALPGMSGW